MSIQITRSSITWTIAGNPTHGVYLNGDPWVVGPITVEAISPATAFADGHQQHGSQKNVSRVDDATNPPTMNFYQGFDSALDTYSAPLNVALALPLAMVAGDSLVSTRSVGGAGSNWTTNTSRAAVLTVVAAPPAANAFRPPYWYPARPAGAYVWDDAMLDQLPNHLDAALGSNIVSLTQQCSELWLVAMSLEGSWKSLPRDQTVPYYRDRCKLLGQMFLALCSAIPKAQKRQLAINLCQYGIDLAWAVKNGFYQGPTHATGHKPVIVLMALITGFADFQNVNGLCPVGTYTPLFNPLAQDHRVVWGEDEQTFYVAETSPGVINWGHGGYTAAMIGIPEWGNRHWFNQGTHDTADWDAEPPSGQPGYKNNEYRRCCASSSWLGMVIALTAMGARRMWGHNPYWDYTMRWMTHPNGYATWPQGSDSINYPAWLTYRPAQQLGGVSLGVVGPGGPRMDMLQVAGNLYPWTLRIQTGNGQPGIGLLIRTAQSALRPKRSFFGIPTERHVMLDEGTFQGFIPIGTNAQGIADVTMAAIDSVGTTYTLQAAILINDKLVPTNAIEVSIGQD